MAVQTSSTTLPTRVWEFDVFLSFRGPDTRNNFTDHLYNALGRRGIKTFKDDRELERGKTISSELSRAIEQSRFLIVILSPNYADSTWCLDELAKIVECANQKKSAGQTILPVFYHVEPSHVRKQIQSFQGAFARHERSFEDNTEKVRTWRNAFFQIANIAGWEVDRPEAQVIKEIIETVSRELDCPRSSTVLPSTDLVGMDCCVTAVVSDFGLQLDDVRALGIWGLPGVGKTTVAEFLFERLSDQFTARSFISVGSETSRNHLLDLQEKLYAKLFGSQLHMECVKMGVDRLRNRSRNTKVLIVLDGVNAFDQIENLVGNGGGKLCDWFGPGSRIIITTRNKSLLTKYEAKIYEVPKLTFDDSLLLFCRKAFKKDHLLDDFADLSYKFVEYADGIPLALERFGGFLFDRNLVQWSDFFDSLKENPNEKLHDTLKLSFDGLEVKEKKMFLEIACFFRGQDAERVQKIFESCKYHPKIRIEVLIENSLVTIEDGKLWMHGLLQEMGREIVRGEHQDEPWKRNRLWDHKDSLLVISCYKGTEAVQGLFLVPPHKKMVHLTADPFSKMNKVKLMKIRNVKFSGCIEFSLSNELRVLEWHECPLKFLPSSFEPEDIVEIVMPGSRIEQLWKEIGRPLQKLVFIDLSDCEYLTKTPDFSTVPKLERLILKGCKKLSAVHPSIGDLHMLTLLNLNGCEWLTTLPDISNLRSLKKLILSGCSRLKNFPDIGENMGQLSELHLDGTALKVIPGSIKHLTGLVLLNFRDCKNLVNLPDVLCTLTSLQSLNLAGCLRIDELPEKFGRLKLLKELDVSRTGIRRVLASSGTLLPQNLRQLSFCGCRDLSGNSMLSRIQSWLLRLPVESSIGLQLPASLSGLSSLVKLDLRDCGLSEGAIPDDLGGCIPLLQHLDLSGNNFVSIPETLSQLPQLKKLEFNNCSKLKSLPKLSSSIRHVYARDCSGLRGTYSSQSPFWTRNAAGLSMIDFGRHQESNVQITQLKPLEQLQPLKQFYQKIYEDSMYEGRSFQFEFPLEKSLPRAWLSPSCSGSSIKVPLLPNWNSRKVVGFALYFDYCPVVEDSDFNCKYFCEFHTDEGPVGGPSIVNEICCHLNRSAASYGHFLFQPGAWFKENVLSEEGITFFQASIKTNRPGVEVKSCEARLIYDEDVVELVRKLVHSQCSGDDPPGCISEHLRSNPLWGFPTSSLVPEEETTSLELTTFQIEPYNSTDIEGQLERNQEALLEGYYPRYNQNGFVMSLRTTVLRHSYQSIGMELRAVSNPSNVSRVYDFNTRLRLIPRDISTCFRGCDCLDTRIRDCETLTRLQDCKFHSRLRGCSLHTQLQLVPCDVSARFRGRDHFHSWLRDCGFQIRLEGALCYLHTRFQCLLNRITLGTNKIELVRSDQNKFLILDKWLLVRFQ